MTTITEYALLAGAAYYNTRNDVNRFALFGSWSYLSRIEQDPVTGFEASAFTNGSEIVISYSGTDPNNANPVTSPDGKTNVDLAAGIWAEQLLQAAEYYLQVKSAPESAGKTITLTGHSLGGGLAALVGVFFEVQAKTFDQAPFAASALDKSGNNAGDLYALLAAKSDGSSAPELAKLSGYLQLRSRGGNNFIPREELITTIRVEGEFLAGGLFGNHSFGNPDKLLSHGPPRGGLLEGGLDLHSQALLTAFLQSNPSENPGGETLGEVSKKLVDLLPMLFEKKLFANDAATDKRNFLDHIVRHEAGVKDFFESDQMVICPGCCRLPSR